MARYKMSVVLEFDSDKQVQVGPAQYIINGCCPAEFNLKFMENCRMSNCVSCWLDALERGDK